MLGKVFECYFMLLRYMKEFVTRNKENAVMLSVDDKCKISVGEPGTPVAAVSRGKQVSKSMFFRVWLVPLRLRVLIIISWR